MLLPGKYGGRELEGGGNSSFTLTLALSHQGRGNFIPEVLSFEFRYWDLFRI